MSTAKWRIPENCTFRTEDDDTGFAYHADTDRLHPLNRTAVQVMQQLAGEGASEEEILERLWPEMEEAVRSCVRDDIHTFLVEMKKRECVDVDAPVDASKVLPLPAKTEKYAPAQVDDFGRAGLNKPQPRARNQAAAPGSCVDGGTPGPKSEKAPEKPVDSKKKSSIQPTEVRGESCGTGENPPSGSCTDVGDTPESAGCSPSGNWPLSDCSAGTQPSQGHCTSGSQPQGASAECSTGTTPSYGECCTGSTPASGNCSGTGNQPTTGNCLTGVDADGNCKTSGYSPTTGDCESGNTPTAAGAFCSTGADPAHGLCKNTGNSPDDNECNPSGNTPANTHHCESGTNPTGTNGYCQNGDGPSGYEGADCSTGTQPVDLCDNVGQSPTGEFEGSCEVTGNQPVHLKCESGHQPQGSSTAAYCHETGFSPAEEDCALGYKPRGTSAADCDFGSSPGRCSDGSEPDVGQSSGAWQCADGQDPDNADCYDGSAPQRSCTTGYDITIPDWFCDVGTTPQLKS